MSILATLALSAALLVPLGPDGADEAAAWHHGTAAPARSVLAAAADAPSFDCARATAEVEALVCSTPELAALDRRLAERFAAALEAAEALGTGDAVERLRASEREFIDARNACASEADPSPCVEMAYLRREGTLVARFELETPDVVAHYACEGGPPEEATLSFFDTELPSARIEYGDTVDTGTLAISGSGSKYDASLGGSVWLKGEAMMFTLPDGKEVDCNVR